MRYPLRTAVSGGLAATFMAFPDSAEGHARARYSFTDPHETNPIALAL
jgi:hypothetical protein